MNYPLRPQVKLQLMLGPKDQVLRCSVRRVRSASPLRLHGIDRTLAPVFGAVVMLARRIHHAAALPRGTPAW